MVFTTDYVDIAIEDFRRFDLDTMDSVINKARTRRERKEAPKSISEIRNQNLPRRLDDHPELADFYNDFDNFKVTEKDRQAHEELLQSLEESERDLLKTEAFFYLLKLRNLGGLVMPVIVRIRHADGSQEIRRYPAEPWRRNSQVVSNLLVLDRQAVQVELDSRLQTAAANRDNNYFPRRIEEERFRLKKSKSASNPMQKKAAKGAKN